MINVAIVGIGNCCSSLYQGLHFYKEGIDNEGLMRSDIGSYKISDIKVVCAFDVDVRKVGKNLAEAIKQKPNCTPMFVSKMEDGPIVQIGNKLDGIAEHMLTYPEDEGFKVADEGFANFKDIVDVLKEKKVDILINYLPVGSQKATEFYAECCLEANVSLLNCIPVFIASNPKWEKKFIDKGIPIIGDDMKSQFGASILSQALQELAIKRGHKVKCHIQRNIGGNTDFLNMIDHKRVVSKKISKENVIRFQCENSPETFVHAGPSEYIRFYKDNKIANFHLELEGFMGSPVILKAELSVIDSPNSAGVVIDAIRYLKVAREMGICGSLRGPSAFTQKTPPLQMELDAAIKECDLLSNRQYSTLTEKQKK